MAVRIIAMLTFRSYLYYYSHYFASLIRVHQGYVAPTFSSLHNYVNRLPLGVVAQITVRIIIGFPFE